MNPFIIFPVSGKFRADRISKNEAATNAQLEK
jgi:hypothetical protein